MKLTAQTQYDALNEFLCLPPFEAWLWSEYLVSAPYLEHWSGEVPF